MRRVPFGFAYSNGRIQRCESNWRHARLLVELAIQSELTYSAITRALPIAFPWIPTRFGFSSWITNPTLRGGNGHRVPRSLQWATVEWGHGPCLISQSEWRILKRLLYIRGHQPRRDECRLFSRLIVCSGCSSQFRWDSRARNYKCSRVGCPCHGAQLEEESLRTATIAALTRRAAPRMAQLAKEWAVQQSESDCYELQVCRDQLARLEALQTEGVVALGVAICQLRDQIVALTPSASSDASTVYDCLLRDPATLEACSDDALRKILLEFSVEIHYVGEGFRVSIGLLD